MLDLTTDDLLDALRWASGIVIILVVSAIAIPLSGRLIENLVNQRTKVRRAEVDTAEDFRRTQTITRVLQTTVKAIIMIFATIAILSELGIDTGALLASAGIAGIAIGFGAQYLVRDYLTGMLLVIEDQYRVGDAVTLNNETGVVEDVNLRITVIRDLNGALHYIPNGEIRQAANLSKDFARINLDMSVAYDSDLGQVIEVIDRVGQDLANDPEWSDRIRTAPSFLRVQDFADSAIIVKIMGETVPLEQWAITGELRRRLKREFDAAEIEIPFPQRVVRQAD